MFLLLDSDSLTLLDLLQSTAMKVIIFDQAKVLEAKDVELYGEAQREAEIEEDLPLPESALVVKELTPEEEEAKKIYESAAGILTFISTRWSLLEFCIRIF